MSEATIMAFAGKRMVDHHLSLAELGIAGPSGVVYGKRAQVFLGIAGPHPFVGTTQRDLPNVKATCSGSSRTRAFCLSGLSEVDTV